MGPNWPRPPTLGRRNLDYQPPPSYPPPSPLVFLQKIEMLKRKSKCCLKPSFPPEPDNCLSGTLIAEPDTSLERL